MVIYTLIQDINMLVSSFLSLAGKAARTYLLNNLQADI